MSNADWLAQKGFTWERLQPRNQSGFLPYGITGRAHRDDTLPGCGTRRGTWRVRYELARRNPDGTRDVICVGYLCRKCAAKRGATA